MPWQPFLGAVPAADGTSFRVWAPRTDSLEVKIVGGPTAQLRPDADGYYTATVAGVRPGARYLYRFPGGRERPDPASLAQPDGVHGPSEVVDLAAVSPRSRGPQHPLQRLVFSEIHLGTFSREGTAQGAARHVGELAEAGYTAVEVMPVAAFPGARNWGYDGVDLFAAHGAYGGAGGLALLVEAAHAHGLSAFLDVVYNHVGPEGNYLGEFGPYFTSRHHTPWGDAVNYDGPDSGPVRRFVIENALRWVASAGGGFDGLRLDAVHGIVDDSPLHLLRELNDAVQREARETGRTIHVIAESDLNEARLVDDEPERRGYGLAAAWADDFHHSLHVALTGESSGYYEDFAPPVVEPLDALVSALRSGWHYGGSFSKHRGRKHGTSATHLPGRRFVVAAQNHDQIGNRAQGERLVALTSPGGLRVAAALTALSPALPLFFQGEEWAAPEPFQYFVSHGDPALVEAVRKGRREEFKAFSWGGEVPDPQAESTFLRSKIDRAHRDSREGRAALRWHRDLLALRREHPALQDDRREALEARRHGPALVLRRWNAGKEIALVALFAEEERDVELPRGRWRVLLDSGADAYAVPGAKPARVEEAKARLCGRHAVVLERTG